MKNLLNEVVTARGFEDALTVELFRMAERGESYEALVAYKNRYEAGELEE